jgi:hypothetical protein
MPYVLGITLLATVVLVAWAATAAYHSFLAHRPKAMLFPCRLSAQGNEGATKYRITVLTPMQDYLEAESKVQAHVQSVLSEHRDELGELCEVKWLKTRWLSAKSLQDESDDVRHLLKQLQKERLPLVSQVERVDLVPAPRGLQRQTIQEARFSPSLMVAEGSDNRSA